MERTSISRLSTPAIILSLLAGMGSVFAQADGGDQFLDGIGETAMIARYVFNGNAQDWSRNNYHASVHGTDVAYVEDSQFGTVLSLPGGRAGGYVQIPGEALVGSDAISVTGWVYLRAVSPWQRFFDFGQDTTQYFFCTPIGDDPVEGYRARITASGWANEQGPVAPRVATGRWAHLAVVLDPAAQTLTSFLDGGHIEKATDVAWTLEHVLDQQNAETNLVSIGKSQYAYDPDLNAKVYDVRLYRVALTARQVATIRNNALSKVETPVSDARASDSDEPAAPTEAVVLPLAAQWIGVPDITVETTVGRLPRLPSTVAAAYRDDAEGPRVRVIWPAPTDNNQVRQAGTYTVTGTVPGTSLEIKAAVTVKEAPAVTGDRPQNNLKPFGLDQVVFNQDNEGRDTPFIKNRDKFILTLAETDPDSFLYNFRDAFGQPQPEGARPLRGWDNQTTRLRGHASGHYLTAIAQAYASTTYDAELQANFRQKMDSMIDTLYELSQKSGKPIEEGAPYNADPTTVPPGPGKDGYDSDLSVDGIRTDYWNWGTGFISGYPPDQFIMLEHGATYGGRNDQVWAPYYTLHKIIAGLLDCYEVGGHEKALHVAKDMGLWVAARLKVLPTQTRIRMWNRYIAGEYGGMNEVMARLYLMTDDHRFLEGARLFDNIDFFFGNAQREHGLAKNVDTIRGKHANQHIPQITGALETYKGTLDPAYYHVASHFWDMCTNGYMYSIGGVAGARNPNNAECFTAEPDTLFANGFARGGQNETCATYNLLKLSRQLFLFDQDGKYMDYYEQALYNHILASVAKDDPGNTYHVPLNPGSRKGFGNADMTGFTCCNGTAIESSTKLQNSIYFRNADHRTLYVNLYVPSTLTWAERDVVVKQSTNFPYADTTKLTITGAGAFDVRVRVPRWATRGFFVTINGQPQTLDAVPGTYLTLSRTWTSGDTIELRMPFSFHLFRVMDQPNIASIFYGPVLLAVQEPAPRTQWRRVTLDADDIGKSIAGDPSTLRFSTNGVDLKPFYETYDRHSVYLDVALE